jgi:predicted HAD superfamily Cof-like phosphohydrolase
VEIIPCANFDPIYHVILLEKSNEWNLSPAKEGSMKIEKDRDKKEEKKKGARIEKQKS